MQLSIVKTLLGLAAATLLTACGGAAQTDLPTQTAALSFDVQASVPAAGTALAAGQLASPSPVADCEPEACKGLRIIDGNAEAYRAGAQQRATQVDQGGDALQEPAPEPVPMG